MKLGLGHKILKIEPMPVIIYFKDKKDTNKKENENENVKMEKINKII